MDKEKLEKEIDKIMSNEGSKKAFEAIADMMLKMMAEEGDDRAVLMLKRDELHEALGGLLGTSSKITSRIKGKLVPLISLMDQTIECAKDILKEVE